MKKLIDRIDGYLDEELSGITISNPRKAEEIRKYTIRPILLKQELVFQVAGYTKTQVFHENLKAHEVSDWLADHLPGYKQVQVRHGLEEMNALLGKKGNASIKIRKREASEASPLPVRLSHNKQKNYILKEGMDIPFLKELGVMTGDGKIVRSRYDKYRQINRFLEFIEDVIPHLPKGRELTIIDFGCGKSYLTFAMYYYLKILMGYPIRIIGLDLKKNVIEVCQKLADSYGYDRLTFLAGSIEDYEGVDQVDMVVTLHACDTATDYALYKAVRWGAKVILSVPCCQHELNGQIRSDIFEPIMDYGLLKERFSALATDGIRAKLLEAAGYDTQILEFIDMEHTPKNILIRGVLSGTPGKEAMDQVRKMCEPFHFRPTLLSLMTGNEEKKDPESLYRKETTL